MIKWCAYCQSFLGESEPMDKFSLTHGICPACAEGRVAENDAAVRRLRPLSEFYLRLRRQVRAGGEPDPADWVAEAARLKLKPHHLLMGVVQPVLYEVGELWARGELSAAREHRFSAFSERMADEVFRRYPELAKGRQSGAPNVLLTNADGNYHTLGVRFLEAGLLAAGLKTFTVLPGLPVREILALVEGLKPRGVALSVSMPGQLKAAKEVSAALAALPARTRPLLLLGGWALKRGAKLPAVPGAYACRSIEDVPLARLRR